MILKLFPRILHVKAICFARCVGFVVPGVHGHDAEVGLLVDEKPSRNDLRIACGWPKAGMLGEILTGVSIP